MSIGQFCREIRGSMDSNSANRAELSRLIAHHRAHPAEKKFPTEREGKLSWWIIDTQTNRFRFLLR